MERMLKKNNTTTYLNAILLVACLVLCYKNYEANATIEKTVSQIRYALYYKLNIRIEAPRNNEEPLGNNLPTQADIALITQDKQLKKGNK